MVGGKEMKIEITNSDYNEVLGLLAQFPDGKVTAKNGSAFWECSTGEPKQAPILPQQKVVAQGQRPKQQSGNPFLRAFDSMAERF